MQIYCQNGDFTILKTHLKSEHDIVKYMVEFILHLCLTSEKEREDIIKTLRPRADWFVQNGVIENNMKLFENKELPLERTEDQSFKADMIEEKSLTTIINHTFNAKMPIQNLQNYQIPKVDDIFERDKHLLLQVSNPLGKLYPFYMEKEGELNTVNKEDDSIKIEFKIVKKTSYKDGSWKCYLCDYTTKKKYSLTRHIRINQNHENTHKAKDNRFKCEICKEDMFKYNLSKHMIANHQGSCPYDNCKAVFNTSELLSIHIKRKHKSSPKKFFRCDICFWSFNSQKRLNTHIGARHYSDNTCPHKCEICKKGYLNKVKLMKHIKRMHTEETPYKCKECSFASAEAIELKQHKKSQHPTLAQLRDMEAEKVRLEKELMMLTRTVFPN